jgi:hypothetical protein
MPYIDKDYYLNTYFGSPTSDDQTLNKTISRASDMIDIITYQKLIDPTGTTNPFDNLIPFIQGQVKKATAALVEHYILNGGYDAIKQMNISSASIGSFSFSMSGQNSSEKKGVKMVPDEIFDILGTTGLLHAGVYIANDQGLFYQRYPL